MDPRCPGGDRVRRADHLVTQKRRPAQPLIGEPEAPTLRSAKNNYMGERTGTARQSLVTAHHRRPFGTCCTPRSRKVPRPVVDRAQRPPTARWGKCTFSRIGVGRRARVAPTAARQGAIRMAQRAPRRGVLSGRLPAPHRAHLMSNGGPRSLQPRGAAPGRAGESCRHIPPMPRSSARGGVSATDRPTVDHQPRPRPCSFFPRAGAGRSLPHSHR